MLAAAQREEADAGESRAEYRHRLEHAMRAVVGAELRRIEPGLPFLATVGSAAPFVGLFGTVWGIMNSFTAIAQSNDTSLAVVAPGIAEALLATALGLAAAIPAVVAYNKLAVAIGRAAQRLHAAIGAIGGTLAREAAGQPRTGPTPDDDAGGAGARTRGDYRPLAEINVTPLVDVMLVLLIIFMVAAPLMVVGVPVDLPQTRAATISQPRQPVIVTLTRAGTVHLREESVPDDALRARLAALREEVGDAVVYVRADRGIDYGRVLSLLGEVGQAGFGKVSLIAEAQRPSAAR